MKPFDKIGYASISTRISILLGIIILLTMGAFSAFSLIKQKDDAIISIDHNTAQLSRTIEKILRISMLKNRREDISAAVNNIVGSEGIELVRIINHNGEIEFSSRQHEISKDVSNNDDLCISCHNKKGNNLNPGYKELNRFRIDNENEIIYSSLPIYNAPSCYNGVCHSTPGEPIFKGKNGKYLYETDASNKKMLHRESKNPQGSYLSSPSPHDSTQKILGFIELEVSIKNIINGLTETRNKLIIFTVLFALLASLITYFSIRYLIGRPVKYLVEGTKRVAEGNFKHDIPPGKAELKLLADSFNKMQKKLLTTQTQLIESERLASVGKLSDEIAVEINNPLTGIIIYSESLIEESGSHSGDEKINTSSNNKKDYEIILREALKIRESIRNILSLTRQEKPVFYKINISSIIKRAISVVEKFSNFRNIQIITGIPETLPDISADPGLTEQVFFNLLLISSESMPTGGIINVSVIYLEDKKEIEITFTDTGKKIPESVLKKIFEPLSVAYTENYEKIAISFTVCKDIIEMHKGLIFINSTEAGTSITIRLPV